MFGSIVGDHVCLVPLLDEPKLILEMYSLLLHVWLINKVDFAFKIDSDLMQEIVFFRIELNFTLDFIVLTHFYMNESECRLL